MTKSLDELLEIGVVLLKDRLQKEFLGFPKIKIERVDKKREIYSYIRFSKPNRFGCRITLTENCNYNMLKDMVEEVINAYKYIIYEKLTKEDSIEKLDEYEPCKEAEKRIIEKKEK